MIAEPTADLALSNPDCHAAEPKPRAAYATSGSCEFGALVNSELTRGAVPRHHPRLNGKLTLLTPGAEKDLH